jgi:uncharacterized protein YkwD
MKSWRWIWGLGIVLSAMVFFFAAAGEAKAETVSRELFGQRVIELVNVERAKQNLPPLKQIDILTNSATAYSQSMADRNFYSHASPDGTTLGQRLQAAGYANWSGIGENLAAALSTPENVVAAWMASPTHRANILSAQFREIGVGYVYEANDRFGPYYHYWTMHLGARYSAYGVIINSEAITTTTSTVNLYVQGLRWAAEMMISNYADFRDARWEPFAATKQWTLLPGNGERTVYVQLRTRQGKMAGSSDVIIVNSPASPMIPAMPAPTVLPQTSPEQRDPAKPAVAAPMLMPPTN